MLNSRNGIIAATIAAAVLGALAPVLVGPAGSLLSHAKTAVTQALSSKQSSSKPATDPALDGSGAQGGGGAGAPATGDPNAAPGGAQPAAPGAGQQGAGGPPATPDDAKTPKLASYTSFSPDNRTVAQCKDAACVVQALGNVAVRKGADAALTEFASTQGTATLASVPCVAPEYVIGLAAASTGASLDKLLASGSRTQCGSNYKAGVVVARLGAVDSSTVMKKVRALCLAQSQQGFASNDTERQCLVGAGHAVLMRFDYKGNDALKACATLGTGNDGLCEDGVFSEHRLPVDPRRHAWPGARNGEAPCREVDAAFKQECYLQYVITSSQRGTPVQDVAKLCRSVASDGRDICSRGIGYILGGSDAQTADAVTSGCNATPTSSQCAEGTGTSMASARKIDAAGKFCATLGGSLRDGCFRGVGLTLAGPNVDQAQLQATCKRIAGSFAAKCIEGANPTR